MLRIRVGLLLSSTVFLLVAPGRVAAAQDSRAAVIGAEQAEKAKTLAPYAPNAAERIMVTLQREILQDPSGMYPVFARASAYTLYAVR